MSNNIQAHCCLCSGNIFPNFSKYCDMGIGKNNINYQCYLLTPTQLIFYDDYNYKKIASVTQDEKVYEYRIYLGKNSYNIGSTPIQKEKKKPEAIIFHRYCWHAVEKILQEDIKLYLTNYPIAIVKNIIKFINIHMLYNVYQKLKDKINTFGIINILSLSTIDNKNESPTFLFPSFKAIYTQENDINMINIKHIANYLIM